MSSDSAMPGANWEGIDMTPIFSPFYWGTVVSLILSGITILQAWIYFPSKDRLFVQLTAGIMIVLDLASTGLVSQGMYHYVVPHFGSLLPLASLTPTLSAECAISVVIILISQLYFAWQIYTVMHLRSAKHILSGLVVLFSIVSFSGGIGCAAVMFKDDANILVNRSFAFSVTAGIAKGASAVADLLATVTLCWTLGGSKTGIKQTDSMIKTLMGFIIQRGILVTAIQTVFLIIFFATESHMYWLALHVNVTRIYANTFFAMLNGRESLKKGQQTYFSSGSNSDHIESSMKARSVTFNESKQFDGVNINKSISISPDV